MFEDFRLAGTRAQHIAAVHELAAELGIESTVSDVCKVRKVLRRHPTESPSYSQVLNISWRAERIVCEKRPPMTVDLTKSPDNVRDNLLL